MTNDNYYPRPHFVLGPLKEGNARIAEKITLNTTL